MKPQNFAVLAAVLVGMVFILLLSGRSATSKDQAVDALPRTVAVVGEGEMRSRPDQVTLTFGVSTWTQGASAKEAEAPNLASRDGVAESARRLGIDSDDIKVTTPTVSPLTRQDYAGAVYLTGYMATSRVVVTLRNMQRVDAVIAAGLGNGATALESVVYGLESPEEARQQAVQAAMENAQGRATAIAQGAERRLGELLSVEVLEEEAPPADSAVTPAQLIFRARVRAVYGF